MRLSVIAAALALVVGDWAQAQDAQKPFSAQKHRDETFHTVSLEALYNSKATSVNGENDGVGFRNGSTYPSKFLPKGRFTHDGVPFALPEDWDALTLDNVNVNGQVLELPHAEEVTTVHMLGAGQDPNGFLKSETMEMLRLNLDNDQTVKGSFLVRNWWCIHNANKGAIRAPYHYEADGSINWNVTHLFHITVDVPPAASGHHLTSIQFPKEADWNNLHVFALTLAPAVHVKSWKEEDKIAVRSVKGTRRWKEVGKQTGQVVEVTIVNPLSASLHGDEQAWITTPTTVSLQAFGITTIGKATLNRLMPGDEQTVEVVVIEDESSEADDMDRHDEAVKLVFNGLSAWSVRSARSGSGLGASPMIWTERSESLEQHSAPTWFNGAKFGIFIHWGLYAVPAFGTKNYAEWYDYWLHDDPVDGPNYKHHLETYGEDFTYDDFIPQFTGEKFDAKEWVDFFADSGAKYFVLTTKHHDGFALFDTKETTHRNSVKLGPKRDFLRELMDAAMKEQPGLKRGTYFSMPEWYNPLYQKYGKTMFPGGLAHNPYNGKEEPYTGFLEVDDYLADVQLQQMRILANDYKTDMMWCDIGLSNLSSTFASEWYAATAKEGRQVTMNDRCGIGGDFDTPEMFQFAHAERAKWESCASMDPYSFGYNAGTAASEYRSAKNVIHSLIDITAKGGNFLLNVGPNGQGKIVEAITKPLLEAGGWLKTHGAAIYDTEPFWLQAEYKSVDADIRFSRSIVDNGVFYIMSLKAPSSKHLVIDVALPILAGDEMTLLSTHGSPSRSADPQHVSFEWKDGKLVIDTSSVREMADSIAWVFQVKPVQGR